MNTELTPSNNFLLYTNQNGEVKVDVLLKDRKIGCDKQLLQKLQQLP